MISSSQLGLLVAEICVCCCAILRISFPLRFQQMLVDLRFPKIKFVQIPFFLHQKIKKNPNFNHTKFHIAPMRPSQCTTTLRICIGDMAKMYILAPKSRKHVQNQKISKINEKTENLKFQDPKGIYLMICIWVMAKMSILAPKNPKHV